MNAPVTQHSLTADLKRLGVRAGDTLMVHASMRAIGPIVGRAATLIDALDAAVGPTGTLLMMVSPEDAWSWVNERPEHERESLLRDALPFDALLTPTAEDVGVLAEAFRTYPGSVVSDHPEGRFAARGKLASELVSAPPWCGRQSQGVAQLHLSSSTVLINHLPRSPLLILCASRCASHREHQ